MHCTWTPYYVELQRSLWFLTLETDEHQMAHHLHLIEVVITLKEVKKKEEEEQKWVNYHLYNKGLAFL